MWRETRIWWKKRAPSKREKWIGNSWRANVAVRFNFLHFLFDFFLFFFVVVGFIFSVFFAFCSFALKMNEVKWEWNRIQHPPIFPLAGHKLQMCICSHTDEDDDDDGMVSVMMVVVVVVVVLLLLSSFFLSCTCLMFSICSKQWHEYVCMDVCVCVCVYAISVCMMYILAIWDSASKADIMCGYTTPHTTLIAECVLTFTMNMCTRISKELLGYRLNLGHKSGYSIENVIRLPNKQQKQMYKWQICVHTYVHVCMCI